MFELVEEMLPHIEVFGVGEHGPSIVDAMVASGLQKITLNAIPPGGKGTELLAGLDAANLVMIAMILADEQGIQDAAKIARLSRSKGALTIGIVAMPSDRKVPSEALLSCLDTLVVIRADDPSDAESHLRAKLTETVRMVSDLLVHPGIIGMDFQDIRELFQGKGLALMFVGEARGPNRAADAVAAALENYTRQSGHVPLDQATSMLINITGQTDLSLFEIDEIVGLIKARVNADANLVFGAYPQPVERDDPFVRVSCLVPGGVTE